MITVSQRVFNYLKSFPLFDLWLSSFCSGSYCNSPGSLLKCAKLDGSIFSCINGPRRRCPPEFPDPMFLPPSPEAACVPQKGSPLHTPLSDLVPPLFSGKLGGQLRLRACVLNPAPLWSSSPAHPWLTGVALPSFLTVLDEQSHLGPRPVKSGSHSTLPKQRDQDTLRRFPRRGCKPI